MRTQTLLRRLEPVADWGLGCRGDVCAGEMAPWEGAAGLPAALFLLHVPGCLALWGPSAVTGTVGGSLSVQCHYEEKFKAHNKYWCRRPFIPPCDKIVETKVSESEVRRGRVSMRDHPANLTFTVTVENLTEDDGGQYRSLLSSVHFLLLVFLEVPLLLGMLSAVLWVNRPQRGS